MYWSTEKAESETLVKGASCNAGGRSTVGCACRNVWVTASAATEGGAQRQRVPTARVIQNMVVANRGLMS